MFYYGEDCEACCLDWESEGFSEPDVKWCEACADYARPEVVLYSVPWTPVLADLAGNVVGLTDDFGRESERAVRSATENWVQRVCIVGDELYELSCGINGPSLPREVFAGPARVLGSGGHGILPPDDVATVLSLLEPIYSLRVACGTPWGIHWRLTDFYRSTSTLGLAVVGKVPDLSCVPRVWGNCIACGLDLETNYDPHSSLTQLCTACQTRYGWG